MPGTADLPRPLAFAAAVVCAARERCIKLDERCQRDAVYRTVYAHGSRNYTGSASTLSSQTHLGDCLVPVSDVKCAGDCEQSSFMPRMCGKTCNH